MKERIKNKLKESKGNSDRHKSKVKKPEVIKKVEKEVEPVEEEEEEEAYYLGKDRVDERKKKAYVRRECLNDQRSIYIFFFSTVERR